MRATACERAVQADLREQFECPHCAGRTWHAGCLQRLAQGAADRPSRIERTERILMHQLHPLLVHACLFGGGYGARAAEVAQRFG